ncbi:3876_t:CDS:2 [Gigaspora rosea]|nr:3876_t:CDS:2 [Gigaspora rosea]
MLDQHLVIDDSKTSYFSVNSKPIDDVAKNMNINEHHKDGTLHLIAYLNFLHPKTVQPLI